LRRRGAAACIAGARTDFFVETHIGHGLEDAGGPAAQVSDCCPEACFERLVSPVGDQLDQYEFTEVDESHVPQQRCLLIALPRDRVYATTLGRRRRQ
jgi:hypothetical protein